MHATYARMCSHRPQDSPIKRLLGLNRHALLAQTPGGGSLTSCPGKKRPPPTLPLPPRPKFMEGSDFSCEVNFVSKIYIYCDKVIPVPFRS